MVLLVCMGDLRILQTQGENRDKNLVPPFSFLSFMTYMAHIMIMGIKDNSEFQLSRCFTGKLYFGYYFPSFQIASMIQGDQK